MNRLSSLLLVLGWLGLPCLRAATFEVNTAADEFDTPSGPSLSLREALRDAMGETNLIHFAPALNGATIILSPTLGEIPITNSVVVDTAGLPDGLTVNGGGGSNRLFYVAPHLMVSLVGLTLTGGHGAGAVGNGDGGAIFQDAASKLMLTRCLLASNSAPARGGAISGASQYGVAASALILERCTLAGNAATGTGVSETKFTVAGGGAIFSGGPLTLSRCTLTGNSAVGGGGALLGSGYAELRHCTVSANSCQPIKSLATGGGGICLGSSGSTLNLAYSIVAGNGLSLTNRTAGADIALTFFAEFNRIGTNIIQSIEGLNQAGVGPHIITNAPLLAPLGNYGGMIPTMALLPGSPARNAGVSSTDTSDQRGFPIVGIPDLGAYEAGTWNGFDAYIWETLPVAATPEQHVSTFDFDGDGMSNADEFTAGTNPNSAASVLRILSLVSNGGNLILTFPSVAGRSYTLAEGDTLAGSWSDSGAQAIQGTGSDMAFTVSPPPADATARFYRVRVGQ